MKHFTKRNHTFFLSQHTPKLTLLHILMKVNSLDATELGNKQDILPLCTS